ncbi:aldehyde-alcohol dehydrogenase [Photobacterium aphoticum]|uniref:Aldehyde-alcohol dehydrogenase n=1 Tax=Photobacterium aphoticum TaxID=754436 RepID=A0A090R9H5_9GAMM|nr:aldehyde-alcohol dehydrogenase [Photobacterium aphoticum]
MITDQAMMKFGIAEKVAAPLKANQIAVNVFADVTSDPDMSVIACGMNAYLAAQPDIVVAVGGGSVIDAAKGVIYTLSQSGQLAHKPYFVAVPTTSGTGSEVTAFSVIKSSTEKWVVVDEYMLPDLAILDPELVKSVPAAITADTGMDVLCHALEAYVSNQASDFSDALAEKAVQLVFSHLLDCYQHGHDLQAREKMHNASCLAGMAFTNASLGITHSLAHALGGKFGVPHGRANALLMSHVVAFNADVTGGCNTPAAKKYTRLAALLGLPASNPQQGVHSLLVAIDVLREQLGLPANIQACGISEHDFNRALSAMVTLAEQDNCTPTSPRSASAIELETLYRQGFLSASLT